MRSRPPSGKYWRACRGADAALRATGWQIANHSYTHNQYWNNKTMTMEQCRYDVGRWVNEIMPYVGETHIFISPFGVIFDKDDERSSLGFAEHRRRWM